MRHWQRLILGPRWRVQSLTFTLELPAGEAENTGIQIDNTRPYSDLPLV